MEANSEFRKELTSLINMHSLENGSDTPDFILAQFLAACLTAFDETTRTRDKWWGHTHWQNGNIEVEPPAVQS